MKTPYLMLVQLAFMLLTLPAKAQVTGRTEEYFEGVSSLKGFRNGNQVVLVSNEKDKQAHIVASNLAMEQNWEQRLDGSILFAGSMENKILVVMSTDFSLMSGGENSTYNAFILNAIDGKIITEKIIYTGNDDYKTIPEFAISKNQKTFTLYARETGYKRNVKVGPGALGAVLLFKKLANDVNNTRSFCVSMFDSNLEIKDKLFPILPDGNFVSAAKTLNNDLYIAVADNETGVTISKFDSGKEKATSSVLEPFSKSKGLFGTDFLNDNVTLFTDTITNNTVYLSGAFKNKDEFICFFNKYDFKTKNNTKFSKSLKRADFKAFEKSYEPFNKSFKSLELGSTTGIEVLKVIATENGFLLAIGDVHYVAPSLGSNLPPAYEANGILMYNLDNNLNELSVTSIPRSYYDVLKPNIKAFYKNNNWYLFSSDYYNNKGKFSIYTINAKNGKLENIQSIVLQKANKSDFANIDQMIITDTKLILPIMDIKMSFSFKPKYDVDLYEIAW